MFSLAFLLTIAVIFIDKAHSENHWALLVAGSNGYENYRHQADICHAYHVLHSHGIPDERIVVMMYDDIAHNPENPFPGNIINEPNGPNVYPGVPKDYTGDEVTPEVFLSVLRGDSEGVKKLLGRSGKVINSGPDDRVFVNFADHGAPGILAFPEEMLNAKDLNDVIQTMYNNKQFKQMVFYIEACESGSMFNDFLPNNINVFATTAANPDESSYACYFDDQRETYLGDVYSVMWMQDSDEENLRNETLQHQYKLVKTETNESHVMEYGDRKMRHLKVADFQGNMTSKSLLFKPKHRVRANLDAVPSEDVPMEILKRKLAKSDGLDHELNTALMALVQRKKQTETYFSQVEEYVSHDLLYYMEQSLPFTDWKCYLESIRLVREMCPGMNLVKNDYALRNLRVLVGLCKTFIPHNKIFSAIGKVSFESDMC